MAPDKAVSFTSMNGEIEVHLPADSKANVRFRTQNGSILTDFPEEVLKTKTEASPAHQATSEAARAAGLAARDAGREAARLAKEVVKEVHQAIREAGGEMHPSAAPQPPKPPHPFAFNFPHPPIPPMVGGKVVSGQLNGGGVDIQIATMNGDIIVRKNAKP
jgi:hypothetical protein